MIALDLWCKIVWYSDNVDRRNALGHEVIFVTRPVCFTLSTPYILISFPFPSLSCPPSSTALCLCLCLCLSMSLSLPCPYHLTSPHLTSPHITSQYTCMQYNNPSRVLSAFDPFQPCIMHHTIHIHIHIHTHPTNRHAIYRGTECESWVVVL